MTHYLVIHEQGEDYSIEHEDVCPEDRGWEAPDGEWIMVRTCLVGVLVQEAGLEDQGIDWRSLSEGRYEIEAWTTRSPSGPWGPEEWDAGIELKGAV